MDNEREVMEKLIDEIFRKLNGPEREFTKVFLEKIHNEHRTLQQCFWKLIATLIEDYAKDQYGHDLRNEASVAFAKAVMEKVPFEERVFPLI